MLFPVPGQPQQPQPNAAPSGLYIPGLSGLSSGLGALQGLTSGNTLGQASGLLQATSLYGRLAGNGTASALGGVGGNVLGLYSGLQQGGIAGYGGAAINGAQLASKAGLLAANPALSSALGVAGAGLGVYNAIKNYQSGATGADAASFGAAGAGIGALFGPVGAGIGLVGGAAVGALASAFGPGRTDAETATWNNYVNQVSKTPQAAGQVSNPYQFLAGVFDEKGAPSTVPMVAQYGRMGEQKFTNDFMSQIQNAVKNGTVSAKSDPAMVYNKVIQPWVNSMNGGKGWNGVGQEYTTAAQGLLKTMTQQYMDGSYANNWKAVGGDNPFYRANDATGQTVVGHGAFIPTASSNSGVRH